MSCWLRYRIVQKVWQLLIKVKHSLTIKPTMLHSQEFTPEKGKGMSIQKPVYQSRFIHNHQKYPGWRMNKWIILYSYNEMLLSKKKELTTDTSPSQRNLKCIRLSVRSHSQRTTYYMSSSHDILEKANVQNRNHQWLLSTEGEGLGLTTSCTRENLRVTNSSTLSAVVVMWLSQG